MLNFSTHGGAHLGSTAGEHEDSVSAACLFVSVPEAPCIFFMRESFRGEPEDRTMSLSVWKSVETPKMGASHRGLPKAVE